MTHRSRARDKNSSESKTKCTGGNLLYLDKGTTKFATTVVILVAKEHGELSQLVNNSKQKSAGRRTIIARTIIALVGSHKVLTSFERKPIAHGAQVRNSPEMRSEFELDYGSRQGKMSGFTSRQMEAKIWSGDKEARNWKTQTETGSRKKYPRIFGYSDHSF